MIQEILQRFNIPTKLIIAENLTAQAFQLIKNIGFSDKKILLVTDSQIYQAANCRNDKKDDKKISKKIGEEIYNNLSLNRAPDNFEKLILENPQADEKNLSLILNRASGYDLIIAAGSGTINDLCKLASFKKSIPYVIFATAPSMNGYLSANASILINGHKKTLPAHLPLAAYFDLDILTAAPTRLIQAGIGDSMCLPTCHFDWLLSHLIFKTDFNPKPFELLTPYFNQLFSYDDLRDKNFIKILSETLILFGVGMYISGGSYPASQGEHLIAHYLEMKYPEMMKKTFHGEQISVTTLTMTRIQEKILKIDQLQIKPIINDNLEKIFSQETAKQCREELAKKSISDLQAKIINNNLQANWGNIKQQLSKVFVAKNQLMKLTDKFNLPSQPNDLGIENKIYQEAVENACLIRGRLTSLDILQLQL